MRKNRNQWRLDGTTGFRVIALSQKEQPPEAETEWDSALDAQRTAQAVELVKECAQRHQVIFMTCKEDLARQLEGNLIRL